MNRDDIIRMAREVGAECNSDFPDWSFEDDTLQRFAALVAAAEREKVAKWMVQHSYATGHGDTTEDLLAELDWQIAENWNRAMIKGIETEREACAEMVAKWNPEFFEHMTQEYAAHFIRARGQR